MNKIHSVLVLITGTLVVHLSSATNIPVSPDSEMGRMMREMDRKGRASQNAHLFTRELQKYQKKTKGACEQLEFSALEEPAESVTGREAVYVMRAKCSKDGAPLRFRVHIRFKDAAMTVVRSTKIMERLADIEEKK